MGKSLLMLAALMASLLGCCQTDEKVSFYGASYIHLSVQEAKGATDVSFRFRTHLADAMLLLAAGMTDYCLIKLEAGRLKVHINLGAGESEISSARGLTLNDLSWHEVNLTRRDANITLQIDVIHTTSSILPGRFFELNIHYGVYIGGQGSFNDLFLGHTEYLRGCMAGIVYNGMRVIEYARARKGPSEATAVTWGCSPEFEATRRTEMSFVEDGAFTAIPRLIPRSGSRWEVELKTAAYNGLLLYNAGQSSHADFLGIELLEGKIRVLMNKGNGPTELLHGSFVADGRWHKLVVDFSPSSVVISVDGHDKTMALPSGGNRYLDLADTFYVGGAELNKRAKALGKGLKSGDASYKGCLRGMILDQKEMGLPDVKVSQGIVVNCAWAFPCAEADPCISGATCSQRGVRSFKCTCDQDLCIKANFAEDYKVFSNANLPVNLEILALSPLVVPEGERGLVTSENIAMILDIAKYGVAESGVVFTLVTPPTHGTLALDLLGNGRSATFTLQDLNQDKIAYHHDGSETSEDSMILDMTLLAGLKYTLPGYLQERLRFPLHVKVTPVNDPPKLEISSSKVLRLPQGTRKMLSKDLIWAHDVDTPAESLVYTVLRTEFDAGHVEKMNQTAQPVDTFTQAELKQGLISYVHRGNAKLNAKLGLQVSDGLLSSQPQYLRISAYPLQLINKYNTGLVVVHRSFSHLTPLNLTFVTNSEDPNIEIQYEIVKPPQYGLLQRLRDLTGTWINVDRFSSRDLEFLLIRYLHNVGSPSQDDFKYRASVREVRAPETFDFRITFIDLELREIRRNSINFTNTAEIVVDSQSLIYQTSPLATPTNRIVYTPLKGPRYGDLILNHQRLKFGQSFTQEDVDSNKVRYRLFRRAYSPIDDIITLKITAPQCSDIISTLTCRHILPKNAKVPAALEIIRVLEGGRVPLNVNRTNFEEFGVTSLDFNITYLPKHGMLAIFADDAKTVVSNVTYFTSSELLSSSVYYVHDDSENNQDFFEFLAVSTDNTDLMYIGAFRVVVEMKNDNTPERKNRKVFHVVSKSERLITKKDLLYSDRDLDTKPKDLVYTVRQLHCGAIYKISDSSRKINEFTQQDIDDEIILFRHTGDDHDKFEFNISDGKLSTKGYLEIQAGPPYVLLNLNQGSVVQANRSVALSSREVEIETNVHTSPKDVVFSVLDKPRYGVILKHNRETTSFDLSDLTRETVFYKHIGGSLVKDKFRMKVNVNGAEDDGIFQMRILPESYWEPLIVQHNKTIVIEEATSVIITRKSIEVMHPDIPPSRITYYIKEWPKHGYLEVQTMEDRSDEIDFDSHLVKHFEQSLINDGRVYYMQSAPNQTEDRFVVDVTNGITWLQDLVVNFKIIPDKLYMMARNLSVLEGKSVVLPEANFYTSTTYFSGKIVDYRIVEKPKHGNIVDSTKNSPVVKFSQKHLNAGVLLYKHNGDESLTDSFKLIAASSEKNSEVFTTWINVHPINDEVPIVVNKTKFDVWQGGTSLVKNSSLAAVDKDTVSNDVVFNVTHVKNGFFSATNSPALEANTFSQKMIDDLQIMFTHTNGTEATFSFTVSDGPHTTPEFSCSVGTRPVLLALKENSILNVFPLARKPITTKQLLTRSTDGLREIMYFVRSGPHLGKIIMETHEGSWLEVDRFTQKDVNDSKVIYEHAKQFMDLSANDSFTFDVEAHFAPTIRNQVFRIDISVSSGGLDRFIAAPPVRVEEGGSANVFVNISGIVTFLRTKAGIDYPVILYRLIEQPNHGHVMLVPDLNVTTFSQSQIEGNKVSYFHDHSDTLEDRITFSLYLSPGQVLLCNITVVVNVNPVNDEMFKLETTQPFINVVQNQTQTITRDNLRTTDPDTGPEDISYEVITDPTFGRLLLLSSDQNSSEQTHHVAAFTQRDIDASRVVYEHSGPLQVASFYFRVSDGQYNPTYMVFTIYVLPILLNVTLPSPVELQQGSNVALISVENVKLATNARQELVVYEVTDSPKHGVLYVRDKVAVNFKHSDLLSKGVMYMQTDMTASNDSFELNARISDAEIRNIRVAIRVVPLMIANPMSLVVLVGERKKLSLEYIDATPLSELTGSTPSYKVIRKPKYAKLKRIMNSTSSSGEKRGTREKEIVRFSHEEIVSGVIYLVGKRVPASDYEGVPDSFGFILEASIFQPAVGQFDFHVRLDPEHYNMTLEGPMDPVGHEGEMTIAPNMSNDYLLVLSMLLGVFSLGLTVIITIRCRQTRYKEAEEDKEESPAIGVMPMSRAPDHLLPATPHLKRFSNDHNNVSSSTPLPPMPSMTSTLPQCKVIPLSPLESITGSEVDVSVRYPYGVADADEWSSFETTDLPCQSATSQRSNPLLRRNQYWV